MMVMTKQMMVKRVQVNCYKTHLNLKIWTSNSITRTLLDAALMIRLWPSLPFVSSVEALEMMKISSLVICVERASIHIARKFHWKMLSLTKSTGNVLTVNTVKFAAQLRKKTFYSTAINVTEHFTLFVKSLRFHACQTVAGAAKNALNAIDVVPRTFSNQSQFSKILRSMLPKRRK
jgi:hypothetical protein